MTYNMFGGTLNLAESINPLLAKTITHPAAQSVCGSWAPCVKCYGPYL